MTEHIDASRVEHLARRLRTRGGQFLLMPSTRNVVVFEGERDGRLITESIPVDNWLLNWWPAGQGPGRKGRGNPFCQRSFEADTIEEALRQAVKATAPRRAWLDDRSS